MRRLVLLRGLVLFVVGLQVLLPRLTASWCGQAVGLGRWCLVVVLLLATGSLLGAVSGVVQGSTEVFRRDAGEGSLRGGAVEGCRIVD